MKQIKSLGLSSMIVLFTACGGQSSDDSSLIPDTEYVVITEDNSNQVLSEVPNSTNIATFFENGPIPISNVTSKAHR